MQDNLTGVERRNPDIQESEWNKMNDLLDKDIVESWNIEAWNRRMSEISVEVLEEVVMPNVSD